MTTTRGWDRYITDRDREVLERSGRTKTEPFGLGEKPALLLIDLYYAGLGPKGVDIVEAVERWPMACGREGWEAVAECVRLLQAARNLSIPVIHIGLMKDFPSPWAREERNRETVLDPAEERIAYDLIAETEPIEGEAVINKSAPSAFWGTPLAFHLNAMGIDSLIVAGQTTSGCVRASVVDAATHRFKVGIVEEACFDRTQASHWVNLFDMDQKYGDVVSTDAALEYFQTRARQRL